MKQKRKAFLLTPVTGLSAVAKPIPTPRYRLGRNYFFKQNYFNFCNLKIVTQPLLFHCRSKFEPAQHSNALYREL